jgi:hypothetical protein
MTRSADHYFAIIPENILYADISHIAVRVYGVLRRHADKDNGTCHPGRSRIAKVAHTSPSSVDRAISELVRIGAIEVIHRPDPDNPKRLLSNQYRLLTPPAHDDTPPAGDDTPLPLVAIPPPASDEETIVKEPKSKNTDTRSTEVDPMFLRFWENYPRKVGKKQALKAWNRYAKRNQPKILDGLTAWNQHWRHEKTETQYIPHPTTWLRQERWEDHPLTTARETRPYDTSKRRGCNKCDNTGYIHHEDNNVTWVTECECNQ